jgi:ABC-type multidrug transport system ATPase subunit
VRGRYGRTNSKKILMQISLKNIGKKYNRNWIFENVNYTIEPNSKVALLGNNGSGKSTLLQIISGHVLPTVGEIQITKGATHIEATDLFKHIAYCAPSLELIEEFTIQEFLNYHFLHKPCTSTVPQILYYIGLSNQAGTYLSNCSSGMKQRVKLAQAFFSNTPILMLDEPCTNLDADGYALYKKMVAELTAEKTVIVSSNDAEEHAFCTQQINLINFK